MGKKPSQFVRNANDKKKGVRFGLIDAFRCAGNGVRYVVATQRNIKIQAAVALLAIVFGFVLSLPLSSWLAIIICIAAVFCAECMNTALESVVDLVSPEYHELAKRAKDCAAAGVLICAFCSVVIGVVVYSQAIMECLGIGGFF
ncbi:MAG: diacylglycerol kinase family protein [Raoultibacter sp.]|jgi:diacylglycerol kinase